MPYIAPVEKREFLAPRHFVHYSGPPQCACATLRPLKWPDAFEGLRHGRSTTLQRLEAQQPSVQLSAH